MIRVGRLPYRFGDGPKTHPTIPDFKNVNVSTSSNQRWKRLSPMILGPFYFKEVYNPLLVGFDGVDYFSHTHNMENWWQGMKVYPQDLSGDFRQVENLKESFFKRWHKMVSDVKPHRRPLPKSQGTPIASYYQGHLLDYVSARRIYVLMYAYLLEHIPESRKVLDELREMMAQGHNLHIIGFDGRDIGPITVENLRLAYWDTSAPFGHELVLAGILAGINLEFLWKNYTR